MDAANPGCGVLTTCLWCWVVFVGVGVWSKACEGVLGALQEALRGWLDAP
jgi:hypothetical protein